MSRILSTTGEKVMGVSNRWKKGVTNLTPFFCLLAFSVKRILQSKASKFHENQNIYEGVMGFLRLRGMAFWDLILEVKEASYFTQWQYDCAALATKHNLRLRKKKM